jgi:hypothetical protein
MPEIVADPPSLSFATCFSRRESSNLNNLVLILFCLVRATRADVSSREAPATRGGGRAASPTPSGGCSTLLPGR